MGVTGIGGIFLRAEDPAKLTDWYAEHLGVNNTNVNYDPWIQQKGPTVFATFPKDSDYFGKDTQNFMLNFRVDDLDAVLTGLRSKAVKIVKEIEDQTGVGKFAAIEDPEGNRVELWQPEA